MTRVDCWQIPIQRTLWSIVVQILLGSSLKMAWVDLIWDSFHVRDCVWFWVCLNWVFIYNHRLLCYIRLEHSEVFAWLILVRVCINVHQLNRDRFDLFLLFKKPFVTPGTWLVGYYHKYNQRCQHIKPILRLSNWDFLLDNHISLVDHKNDSFLLVIDLLLWHGLVSLRLVGSYRFYRVGCYTSDDHLCSHLESCFLGRNTFDMHEYSVSELGRIIESVVQTFDHYWVFSIKQAGSLIESHLHTTVVIKCKPHIVSIVDIVALESGIVGTKLVIADRLRCEGAFRLNRQFFFCLNV